MCEENSHTTKTLTTCNINRFLFNSFNLLALESFLSIFQKKTFNTGSCSSGFLTHFMFLFVRIKVLFLRVDGNLIPNTSVINQMSDSWRAFKFFTCSCTWWKIELFWKDFYDYLKKLNLLDFKFKMMLIKWCQDRCSKAFHIIMLEYHYMNFYPSSINAHVRT